MFLLACAHEGPFQCDLERMMNIYGDELLRLCYLYLKDHHLAEDALQDAFIKVYTKYGTFKGLSSEKTWVYSVTLNVLRDYLKKRRDVLPGDDGRLFLDLPTPEDEAMASLRRSRILHEVCALPQIYREVILLYYYSGFSTQEISKILKSSESTVSVRLSRARAKLRPVLEEESA